MVTAEDIVRLTADQVAEGVATLRVVLATVVDESNGRVRLAFADDQGVPGGQYYERLAGAPYVIGQRVRCLPIDGDYIVLGPVQQGAARPSLNVEDDNALVQSGANVLDFKGSPFLVTGSTNPSTGEREAAVTLNTGTGAGQIPTADVVVLESEVGDTVQRPLVVQDMNSSVMTNPSIIDYREGMVAENGGVLKTNVRLDFGAPGGADANQVPRNPDVNRKMTIFDNGTQKVVNPGGIDFRNGLTVTAQGDGYIVDADPVSGGAGSGGNQRTFLPSGPTWVSAQTAWAMRNPTAAAVSLSANVAYGTLLDWSERAEYDSFGFRVTTAGAAGTVARMSVYRLDPVTLTVTVLDRTGNIAVDSVGWKQIDYGWGIQESGILVVFLVASGAVSIAGLAANALAFSPLPALNYSPPSSYTTSSAPPIPQGIQRSQAFGDLPSPWVMSASHLVTSALPVGWLLAQRRP